MSNRYSQGVRQPSDEFPLTEEAVRGFHTNVDDRNSQIEQWRDGLNTGSHDESVSPGDQDEHEIGSKHNRQRKRVRRRKTVEGEPVIDQSFGNLNRSYSPSPHDRNDGGPVPGLLVSPPSNSTGFGLENEESGTNAIMKSDPLAVHESGHKLGESSLVPKRPSLHMPRNSKGGSFSGAPKHRCDSREALLKNQKNFDVNKEYFKEYVSKNFTHRMCCRYVSDPKNKEHCACGRHKDWHSYEDVVIFENDHFRGRETWHPDTHTVEVKPDSFGEIEFNGFGREFDVTVPYIRADYQVDFEALWELLTNGWNLPPPRLLISVTGGNKNFNIKQRLLTTFKKGLMTAASTTGAWIITGGMSAGVMKLVGEAVRENVMSSGGLNQKVVALGVATWGYIDNKEALEGDENEGAFPCSYSIEDLRGVRHTAPLDHNHTHFILVDNGTEKKYGVEIGFRAALETFIAEKMETQVGENQSVNVPVVLLVLEGGMSSIESAAAAIKNNIPIVAFEGSGRAADYLAYAYKITRNIANEDETIFPEHFDDIMKFKAERNLDWSRETEASKVMKIDKCVDLAKDCLRERRLVSVFQLDTDSDPKDIDKAIIHALLKANKSHASTQLNLALAWNRCDIARAQIFQPENMKHWKQQTNKLYDAMFIALVQNRVDFVQLFLDVGVEMRKFVSVRRLRDLYHKVLCDRHSGSSRTLLKNLIREVQNTLKFHLCFCYNNKEMKELPNLLYIIGKVFRHLVGDQYPNMYEGKEFEVSYVKFNSEVDIVLPDDQSYSEKESNHQSSESSVRKSASAFVVENYGSAIQLSGQSPRRKRIRKPQDFSNPERELFIWAVLLNRRELALQFWRQGKNHVGSALIAASMLKALSHEAAAMEEIDLSADYLKHSKDYEKFAIGALSECYNMDKRLTHCVLIRTIDSWGGTTCLNLADTGEHMEFMGHTACQTHLNRIWKGNMALYTSVWKILISTVIPIIICWIQFAPTESAQSRTRSEVDRNKVTPGKDVEKNKKSKQVRKGKVFHVGLTGTSPGTIGLHRAIYYFYTAPITKFIYAFLSQLVYLGLFSYFLLTNFYPYDFPNGSPSVYELFTIGWTFTLIGEEFRQVFTRDPHSVQRKVSGWFVSVWNKFDLLIYVIFVTAMILRFSLQPQEIYYARNMYAVSLSLSFLRFMQMFFFHKDIGPKVIMIRKMMVDLMFFVIILLVFILSYGVASHALLYPNAASDWLLLKNVLYLPYFQMYGELFLENVEAKYDNTTDICSRDHNVWKNDPTIQQCPEFNSVAIVLFIIYMIMTNILLLNLLIAMFSYTFQMVQENSELVWRFHRFALIHEYFDRPAMAAPIIIFGHVYRVCRHIYRRATKASMYNTDFKMNFSKEKSHQMIMLEKHAMEAFLAKAKLKDKDQMSLKLTNTGERVEKIITDVEEVKEVVIGMERPPKEKIAFDESGGKAVESKASKEPEYDYGFDPKEELEQLHIKFEHLELKLADQNDHMQRQNAQMDIVLQQLQHLIDKKPRKRKPRTTLPPASDEDHGERTPRRLPLVESSIA
ncbi:transient receptor potential cation channel subfamily M member-like 2 [Lineus longissimus]|uniref:transient receptor potential cation channel subfamily M member-like 2 n=1 Tax=Lineus longissimus TaxID=88925 RepID=UPI002B4C98FD